MSDTVSHINCKDLIYKDVEKRINGLFSKNELIAMKIEKRKRAYLKKCLKEKQFQKSLISSNLKCKLEKIENIEIFLMNKMGYRNEDIAIEVNSSIKKVERLIKLFETNKIIYKFEVNYLIDVLKQISRVYLLKAF